MRRHPSGFGIVVVLALRCRPELMDLQLTGGNELRASARKCRCLDIRSVRPERTATFLTEFGSGEQPRASRHHDYDFCNNHHHRTHNGDIASNHNFQSAATNFHDYLKQKIARFDRGEHPHHLCGSRRSSC